MYLKNSLILINEFFYYTKNQIRNLYLKSRFYNNKISKIILSESKITSQLVNFRTTISKIFYFDKPIKESEKRIEKLIKDLES